MKIVTELLVKAGILKQDLDYRAGQKFPEMPGDRQSLDENASKTEPAKLLAVFVLNKDEKELLTPLKK